MVEIRNVDGIPTLFGIFDFGYMGKYTEEKIDFPEISELRDWDCISDKVDVTQCTDEEIMKALAEYINQFEKKIQENIKQVNNNFLISVFTDMESCGSEFWEIDELTIREALPEDPEENVYQPHWDEMKALEMEYWNTPNDGSLSKTDVEPILREKFPMFNWDRLLNGIIPECLSIEDGYISFECSDDLNCRILCAAYDCLNEDLEFTDWHNF